MAKKNQAPYGGVFEGIDFPDYEYRHYPLMMRKGSGKLSEVRVVANESEEKEALAEGFNPPERVGPPISLTEKEHKALTDEIAAKDAENAELRKTLEELKVHLKQPEAVATPKPVDASKPLVHTPLATASTSKPLA